MPSVQRALADEKYEIPTPIQAQTIPSALDHKDVLGCAQTGTGKTAAFALPILNQLGRRNRKSLPNRPFVLVLAPTRELAIQIGDSFATYGKYLKLRHALVYGGVGQGNQVRALRKGAHILVATPGRLLDLMEQGHIKLDQLDVFVLDEADRMLDMGFLPDLKRIISRLPDKRQSLFFSATMPPKIVELAETLLTDPVSVDVTPEKTSVELIDQQVLFVERNGKLPLLREILNADDAKRTLVFTKTKRGANLLADKLVRIGIRATAIHGNKSQAARQRALEAFRNKQVSVLVATDVAARGIDIDGITHVINFDLPVDPESYVHRIGRTGRAGAAGIALTFCSSHEKRELRAIEQLIGMSIPPAENQPEPSSRKETPSTPSNSGPKKRPQNRKPNPSGRPPARRADVAASEGESKPKPKKRSRRSRQRRSSTAKQTT